MKEDQVKIVQITVNPYKFYTSNGSPTKDEHSSHQIFGLGDDCKVYRYGLHKFWHDKKYNNEHVVGWREYVPIID